MNLSKVIVVPPQECTEKLEISCMTQFGDYILLGTNEWIYIFDAVSLKALSYWKAHDTSVAGIVVAGGKIWSFGKDSVTIKLWIINIQNGALKALKQIPLHNTYSKSDIAMIKLLGTNVWCFHKDGNLTVIDESLKQIFSASWLAGGSIVNHVVATKNRIVVCTDRLLLGLGKQ